MPTFDKDCLFCKIISGQIPSKKVFENEEVFAFLDIFPIASGHTVVVPTFSAEEKGTPLPTRELSEVEQARLVLEAHESLVEANPETKPNFLDVIDFLKERLKY
jgi:diadenosine tetraphosphate (Ap4A) HIT family hydrolase